MFEVYLIENDINDKVYVGVTSIGVKERWYAHRSCANQNVQYPLYQDMRNYGLDKFHIRVIASTDDEAERDKLEIQYIEQYNSFYPNGYNLTQGGVHTKNPIWLLDDELRNARIQKIRESNTGKPKSLEHRKHLSEARIGKFTQSDNPFFGKTHSDETKRIISDKNSSRPVDMLDKCSEEVLLHFKNLNDAGRYIVESGLSTAMYTTCALRIGEVVRSSNPNCTAYGFKWRLVKV